MSDATIISENPNSAGHDPQPEPDWLGSIMPSFQKTPTAGVLPERVTAEPVSTAAPPAPTPRDVDPTGKSCPVNPDYNQIIDTVISHAYDPRTLGDLDALRNKYNCQITTPEDAITFGKEALQGINDPYARLFSSTDAAALAQKMTGELTGVGLTIDRPQGADGLRLATGPIAIKSVVGGGPAAEAGLQPGDLILKVNGEDVANKSLDDAITQIRGPVDTSVKLTISRNGEVFDKDITRAIVQFPVVTDRRLENNIAYIRLDSFESLRAAEQVKAALERHSDASGFILDLRDNPGGTGINALLISSLFMSEGIIMKTSTRVASPASDPRYEGVTYSLTHNGLVVADDDGTTSQSARYPDLVNKPTVVLANGNSASASEVVIGALKDNKEATVIGVRTFGKGVGQTYFEGPQGSIVKLTVARTTNPSGYWVGDGVKDLRGIGPDIQVENPKGVELGSAQDTQLNTAVNFLTEKQKESAVVVKKQ